MNDISYMSGVWLEYKVWDLKICKNYSRKLDMYVGNINFIIFLIFLGSYIFYVMVLYLFRLVK